jgi:hypothetical protein
MMTPHQPDPPYFLALKNGSLAANHTHLDLNHISVAMATRCWLSSWAAVLTLGIISGRRRYSYYELTTAGHNTVLIGGKGQVRGKQGKLLGPFKGAGYEALTGVADGAYEVAATQSRRHVVFVDKRFWILIDEIATPDPEAAELRFHTYGKVTEPTSRHWVFEQGEAALDIVTPILRSPEGWRTLPDGSDRLPYSV